MPQVLTEVVARPPVGGAFLGYIDKMIREFASTLTVERPSELDRAVHWLMLAALVCGAAIVRFWGLGAVGLHGDEETMGMAVRGIVEHGAPVLPSGMFYPRGLSQLYPMALSVLIFGESEWALRLPSVLCGIAIVPIGYVLGRRFLRPNWSLALAAALAFLPELIEYSQTARMYIFLVAYIAASMACVFAWERTGHIRWLVAAAALLVPGIEMHTLAVASMLMFLFPGIVQGDIRKIGAALVAMVAVSVAFLTIDSFVNAQYPTPPAEFVEQMGAAPLRGSAVVHAFAFPLELLLIAAGIVFAYFGVRVARTMAPTAASIIGAALLLGGLALQLALFYHLAAIFYLAGAVVAVRFGALDRPRDLIVFAVGVVAIALAHAMMIAPSAGTPVRLVGAMIGQPSVWQYLRVTEFSRVAGLACVALLFFGLWKFAFKAKVPDFWVLSMLGLWAPVFALGLFAWNVPSRYTSMSLIPLLVCALATLQLLHDRIAQRPPVVSNNRLEAVIAAVAGLLVINPVASARTMTAGYSMYPDHKGAAEFIRSLHLGANDIVLAEDVLQQTYYLGRVDYWLIGPSVARRFVMKSENGVVDFYTGTPVIVTTAMLDGLLAENPGKRVYIVGTGEGWSKGKRGVRGEMSDAIESARFETLYVGRDGLTKVLRSVPAKPAEELAHPEDQREIERALIEAPEE